MIVLLLQVLDLSFEFYDFPFLRRFLKSFLELIDPMLSPFLASVIRRLNRY